MTRRTSGMPFRVSGAGNDYSEFDAGAVRHVLRRDFTAVKFRNQPDDIKPQTEVRLCA